jgi:uncharacterized protein (UPF0548 family)
VKTVRPSSAKAIERVLSDARVAHPTYEPIGATVAGVHPDGFHRVRLGIDVGQGSGVFERAVLGLKTWKEQDVPFTTVHPAGVPVEEGETILITIGLGVIAVAVPCRIVAVVDEADRWGFAYGTLPGHLEQGEECFMLTHGPDGTVHFEIWSFSRPADTLMKVLGPLGRFGQRTVVRSYLRALKKFVEAT